MITDMYLKANTAKYAADIQPRLSQQAVKKKKELFEKRKDLLMLKDLKTCSSLSKHVKSILELLIDNLRIAISILNQGRNNSKKKIHDCLKNQCKTEENQ